MSRKSAAKVLVPVAALAACCGLVVGGVPADAAKPVVLPVHYDAVGTTHIKKADVDVPLGPSVLNVQIQPTGEFTADLPIPSTTVSFDAFGSVPVSALVSFVQVAPATGKLTPDDGGRTTVTTTAQYVIQLYDVSVAGQDANVGDFCQTTTPVTLNLATPANGPGFDVSKGGRLKGYYSIPRLKDCGTNTALANKIVPGASNRASVLLSNGTFGNTNDGSAS